MAVGILALGVPVLAACKREQRELRMDPPVAAALDGVALMPGGVGGALPLVYTALEKPFENNAYALAQGKRLYASFGCRGCHGDGEGGKGPALTDGWWSYGPDLASLYATLKDGRPGGMPPYRDKLTTEQIWQVAGYVQTLGAYSAKTAAPSRDDGPQRRPAENRGPASNAPLEPTGR